MSNPDESSWEPENPDSSIREPGNHDSSMKEPDTSGERHSRREPENYNSSMKEPDTSRERHSRRAPENHDSSMREPDASRERHSRREPGNHDSSMKEPDSSREQHIRREPANHDSSMREPDTSRGRHSRQESQNHESSMRQPDTSRERHSRRAPENHDSSMREPDTSRGRHSRQESSTREPDTSREPHSRQESSTREPDTSREPHSRREPENHDASMREPDTRRERHSSREPRNHDFSMREPDTRRERHSSREPENHDASMREPDTRKERHSSREPRNHDFSMREPDTRRERHSSREPHNHDSSMREPDRSRDRHRREPGNHNSSMREPDTSRQRHSRREPENHDSSMREPDISRERGRRWEPQNHESSMREPDTSRERPSRREPWNHDSSMREPDASRERHSSREPKNHDSSMREPDTSRERRRRWEPQNHDSSMREPNTSRGHHEYRKRQRESYDNPTHISTWTPQHYHQHHPQQERMSYDTSTSNPRQYHQQHPQHVELEEPPTKLTKYTSSISSHEFSSSISSHQFSYRFPPSPNPDCPDIGEPIADILIPSKLPLPDKPYSPHRALKQQRELQRPVALVIDLTDFSSPTSIQWQALGVKFIKLPCKGLPDNVTVNTFVYETMRFVRYYEDRGQTQRHILVYCTNGYNRTGFMIVHYLLRSALCSSVEEALGVFASARPPGIYNPRYVDALFEFYNQRKPTTEPLITYPEWCTADNDDDDMDLFDMSVDRLSDWRSISTLSDNDVLGDPIPVPQQYQMQKQICEKLGIPMNSGFDIRFPGLEPVCLNRDRLGLLRENYYYVSWKAEGCRYMMLIKRDGCYLIDTKFVFRRVQLRFPKRKILIHTHHVTLVDGEMVIDENKIRRYLVYDILILNGESMSHIPFCERWKLINKELIQPRQLDAQLNMHYNYGLEPFTVMRKDFWMLSTIRKLLENFIPKLPHRASGLVFRCWEEKYVAQTNDHLNLNWKHRDKNSVNFLYELENVPCVYIWEEGRKRKLEGVHVKFGQGQEPWEFEGKIIKCSWNINEEAWEFIRLVRDKVIPDSWGTYLNVKKDIQDEIDRDELLSEIDKIVQLPLYTNKMSQELRNVNELPTPTPIEKT